MFSMGVIWCCCVVEASSYSYGLSLLFAVSIRDLLLTMISFSDGSRRLLFSVMLCSVIGSLDSW